MFAFFDKETRELVMTVDRAGPVVKDGLVQVTFDHTTVDFAYAYTLDADNKTWIKGDLLPTAADA